MRGPGECSAHFSSLPLIILVIASPQTAGKEGGGERLVTSRLQCMCVYAGVCVPETGWGGMRWREDSMQLGGCWRVTGRQVSRMDKPAGHQLLFLERPGQPQALHLLLFCDSRHGWGDLQPGWSRDLGLGFLGEMNGISYSHLV